MPDIIIVRLVCGNILVCVATPFGGACSHTGRHQFSSRRPWSWPWLGTEAPRRILFHKSQEMYTCITLLDRHMHRFSDFGSLDVLGQFNPNSNPNLKKAWESVRGLVLCRFDPDGYK